MAKGLKKEARSIIILKTGKKYYVINPVRKIYEKLNLPGDKITVTIVTSQREEIVLKKSDIKTYTAL